MNVLVDTSMWSLTFRRKKNQNPEELKLTGELIELIREGRTIIIGPIRQELLSGIANKDQYLSLKAKLSAFEDIPIITHDYELAADFFNQCRQKGIQGSHIDFLICAVIHRNNIPIFTTDKDFERYSKHIEIALYSPRQGHPENI